jgi:hypothetical protein
MLVFYYVNDGKDVHIASHQAMRCIPSYVDIVNVHNPRTKERKGLITYYKTYGIITLKKQLDVYHSIIVFFFEKKVNNPITENVKDN